MSAPASTWDGALTGKIGAVDVTENSNYDFRVYVGGISANACGANAAAYAYLNHTDSNYQVYVSVLLTAYTTGRNVTVFLTKVGSACRIGYVSVVG